MRPKAVCSWAALVLCFIAVAQSVLIPPDHPDISYIGRVDVSHPERAVFDWPCVKISVTFRAEKISVVLNGGNNVFQIVVDGKHKHRLATGTSEKEYLLAEGLSKEQTHKLEMIKLTEASYFLFSPLMPLYPVYFNGFVVEQGTLVPSVKLQQRRFEVFGDSDSNGFGVEGPDTIACISDLLRYENCHFGYPSLLAQWLDVEDYRVEAWSGKGIVKNAVDLTQKSVNPMPIYWNKTVATSQQIWRFSPSWVPDFVLILLGSNDYYSYPFPTDEQFIGGYIAMLRHIHTSYKFKGVRPPKIINICGGVLQEMKIPCKNVEKASHTFRQSWFNETYYITINASRFQYPADFGCLDHLNVQGQTKLANFLLPHIKSIMKWK